MNGIHDVGGMDGFGAVQREDNEPVFHAEWEGRMRAIHTLLVKKHRIYNIDESRHTLERINPIYYLGSTYYQNWLLRMETLLVERGVLTNDEIQEEMTLISPVSFKAHLAPYREIKPYIASTQRRFVNQTTPDTVEKGETIEPKFSFGMLVRAKTISPLGHTRLPRYVRGKRGVIVGLHGNFVLPDIKVAEGLDLYQPVYQVRFEAQELWGEEASPKDKLLIELWEDYLELEE